MPRKITLKGKIAALLSSGDVGSRELVLDDQDVVLLLREAIELAGGSSRIMNVLGLRRVYALHRNNQQ